MLSGGCGGWGQATSGIRLSNLARLSTAKGEISSLLGNDDPASGHLTTRDVRACYLSQANATITIEAGAGTPVGYCFTWNATLQSDRGHRWWVGQAASNTKERG